MIIFCCQKGSENSILNCKNYPQADCNTDDILLVATLRLKLKTCTQPKVTLKKDYGIYKQKEIKKNIYTKTETALLRQQAVDNNDVKELYDQPNRSVPLLYFQEPLNGPTILKSEIQTALSSMRNGKALGSEKISAETLEALNHFGLELLQLLANAIYNKGVFPDELYKSTFITISKKSGAANCENFQTISIMSHVTKVILRVIMLRIRNKIHPEISTEQYYYER